jgi:hypothetical protein
MAATEPADFHQPQVQNIYGYFFATGRLEDLTFCKPDVSDVLKPDVLKPDVLKPDVLWVYRRPTLCILIVWLQPISYEVDFWSEVGLQHLLTEETASVLWELIGWRYFGVGAGIIKDIA